MFPRNIYSSSNNTRSIKSRRMRGVRHVALMGEVRNEYKVLVGDHEWKRPLRRSWLRWEDNIRMDFTEVG
jgi:hypothetical protein